MSNFAPKLLPPTATLDVVIVLGAASLDAPSPSLKRRIDKGIIVFKKFSAKQLLLCGGATAGNPTEADLMARIAVDAGIPQEHIVIESRSVSTWQNATFAEELMKHYRWTRGCIVSDSVHLPRAWLVFRRTPLNVIYLAAAGPLPASVAFSMGMRELIAIAWYLIRLAVARR